MTKKITSQSRTTKANIMMIVVMIAAVIIVAVLVIFTVHFVFFAQKRIQAESDEGALRLAGKLNQSDNAGFVNNLVAYSRESVFNSRRTLNQIRAGAEQLEPLARQLATETRDGALLVEQERQLVIKHTLSELRKEIEKQGGESSNSVSLPWASYSKPEIEAVQIGCIKDVESNAAGPEGNAELLDYDKSAGNLTSGNYYKANKNIALPDADNDLVFKFSSLAAPVKDTISPPRLASPAAFKTQFSLMKDGKFLNPSPDSFPSAVKIEVSSTVKVSMGKDTQDTSRVWSTGVSCGASPPP